MRIIGHLDMDAFFASVEERDNQRFLGKPVVVGADPRGGAGRGVVSTANYKAREYGIHSAMPISRAWRLARSAEAQGKPAAVFVEPDFGKYSPLSESVLGIIRLHSPRVERASIDEAYFDLSGAGSYERAKEIAKQIKKEILEKERLTCSIGIGPNKLIAKIASDMNKPNGLTIACEEDAEKFLEPLSVRKIPGIGPKTEAALTARGVKTISDLKKFSMVDMVDFFGKRGEEMHGRARGIDDSPIVEEYEAKSIGEQTTFERDSLDPIFLTAQMSKLARGIFTRFKGGDFATFGSITITVRFEDFITKNRSRALPSASKNKNLLEFEATRMLMPFLDKRENPKKKKIRLLGVRLEKLA